MATNDPQVNFRLPIDLRDRLKEAADEKGRTLTAEIVYRLEQSFTHPEGLVGRELVSAVLKTLIDDQIIEYTEKGNAVINGIRKDLADENGRINTAVRSSRPKRKP